MKHKKKYIYQQRKYQYDLTATNEAYNLFKNSENTHLFIKLFL